MPVNPLPPNCPVFFYLILISLVHWDSIPLKTKIFWRPWHAATITDKHRQVSLCLPTSWTQYCCVGTNPHLHWESAVMVLGTTSVWCFRALSCSLHTVSTVQGCSGSHGNFQHIPPFCSFSLAWIRSDCVCRETSSRKRLMKNIQVLYLLPRRHKVHVQSAFQFSSFSPVSSTTSYWAEALVSVPLQCPKQQSQQSSCIPHPSRG